MRIPELLAPAGTLEKLKTAVHYGADAVYLGGTAFGLRNMAGNFTFAEMAEGLAFAHARGVKAYLTVNSYPGNDELPRLAEHSRQRRAERFRTPIHPSKTVHGRAIHGHGPALAAPAATLAGEPGARG